MLLPNLKSCGIVFFRLLTLFNTLLSLNSPYVLVVRILVFTIVNASNQCIDHFHSISEGISVQFPYYTTISRNTKVFFTSYISYFSHYCDKTHDKCNLRKGSTVLACHASSGKSSACDKRASCQEDLLNPSWPEHYTDF